MYILRIEYRIKGERKGKTEYQEFNTLVEANERLQKWLRWFAEDCDMYDLGIFKRVNY